MCKKIFLICGTAMLLGACSFADQRFISDQSPETMRANAEAVKRAERAERAEARKERREEMMDQADAIHRAYRGRNHYYIIR